MSEAQAAMLVKRLLGSYASLSLHDPQIYIAELCAMLLKYPLWAAEKGIERAKQDSPKFVPNVPQVEEACEQALGTTRTSLTYAQQWDRHSQLQIEKRREFEIQAKEESVERRAAAVERIRREMAAVGLPFEQDRKALRSETPDGVMAKYGISQEQWNAIPDAPPSGHWEQLQAKFRG